MYVASVTHPDFHTQFTYVDVYSSDTSDHLTQMVLNARGGQSKDPHGILTNHHRVIFSPDNKDHSMLSMLAPESERTVASFVSFSVANELAILGTKGNGREVTDELLRFLAKSWPVSASDTVVSAIEGDRREGTQYIFKEPIKNFIENLQQE